MSQENELSQLLENWMKRRASRTISSLARTAGISYSSAWRAVHGVGVLSQEVSIAIVNSVLAPAEAKQFIEKYYPDLNFAILNFKTPDYYRFPPSKLLSSSIYCHILALASSEEGTSPEELTKIFGERYLPYFNDLIDAKWLRFLDDRWFCSEEIEDLPIKQIVRMMFELNAHSISVR